MSDEVEQRILSNFYKMSCKILSHDGELLASDLVLTELVSSFRQGIESDQFTMDLIHKFVGYQVFFDKMQAVLEKHKEATVIYYDVIIKTVAVARNTIDPDSNELRRSINNFQFFMSRDGKE